MVRMANAVRIAHSKPRGLGLVLGLSAVAVWAQGVPEATEEQLSASRFEELMNVKVSIASRVERKVKDAPAVVSVVRKEEIRIHGWRSLSEVLEQIPGFATRNLAGGEQGLVVRGMFAPDGILVMVDGVSINDPLNGNIAFYDFPLEGIERIEIARGPGSSLYGGYAFLAVVNLISARRDSLNPDTEVQFGGGERGSYRIQGQYESSAPFGHWKVYSGAHRTKDPKVTVGDDLITSFIRRTTVGDRAYDRYNAIATDTGERSALWRQWDAGANLTILEGALEGLSLEGQYVQKRGWPILSRLYALVDQGQLERRDDLFRLGMSWSFDSSDNIRLKPRLYTTSIYGRTAGQITRPYGWDDDEDYDGVTERWPGGRVEVRAYQSHTLGGEVIAEISSFSAHRLSAGFIFERSWLDRIQCYTNSSRLSSGIEVSFNPDQVINAQEFDPKQDRQDSWIYTGRDGKQIFQDIKRNLGAAFVQDIWKLHPQVTATLGLRFDHFSDFGSAVSPRAVVVWNVSDRAYLKGLYGEAFKPPTFFALYDGTVTLKNERQVYGNPALRIATINTGEVLFGYQLSGSLLAQVNVFQTRTRNEVEFNTQFEQYRNEASRRTQGAEFELQGVWQAHRLRLNYSFNDADNGQGSGAPIFPRHQVNLGGEIPGLFSFLDLGATLTWHSSFQREFGDTREAVGSAAMLQAQVGMRLSRNVSVTLGGHNLLGRDARSPVDRTLGGILPGDIPGQGRFMEFQMVVKF